MSAGRMALKTFRCPPWMDHAIRQVADDERLRSDGALIRQAVYAYLIGKGYDPAEFIYQDTPAND